MVLHNTQAVLELAYEDAHASDEYMNEDEFDQEPWVNVSFTCPFCRQPAFCTDGVWTCEGDC